MNRIPTIQDKNPQLAEALIEALYQPDITQALIDLLQQIKDAEQWMSIPISNVFPPICMLIDLDSCIDSKHPALSCFDITNCLLFLDDASEIAQALPLKLRDQWVSKIGDQIRSIQRIQSRDAYDALGRTLGKVFKTPEAATSEAIYST